MKYRDYNDNELLSYIAENNEEAVEILYEKYRPLIVANANRMSKTCQGLGIDVNDLIQEGMIGLNGAIKHYSENKEASFYTFAKTCIERKMISLIAAAKRQKNKILNESLSLDVTLDTGEIVNLEELIGCEQDEPFYQLLNLENEQELLMKINQVLTPLEKQVFQLKIAGFDYHEISEKLNKKPKAIDNALQRIKNKIKKIGGNNVKS